MNIRIYLMVAFALSALTPIKVRSQYKIKSYIIECTFKGLPDKTKAYLTVEGGDTVQRALSIGDKVTFNGKLDLDGRFHFIKFDTLVSKIATKAIFVSNKEIVVKGVVGQGFVEVYGSPEHNEYLGLISREKQLNEKFAQIERDYHIQSKPKIDSIKKLINLNEIQLQEAYGKLGYREMIDSIQRLRSADVYDWLVKHPKSLLAPYVMDHGWHSLNSKQVNEIYGAFTPEVKSSYYGISLKYAIDASSIVKGSIIQNFLLKNPEGKIEKLHDLIKGSKYTLIDCWASWCSPCRAEVPKLKLIYEKYRSKGLKIIGISSDKKDIDWKKALAEDKTPWQQVLEIERNLSNSLSIGAIPAYILVDGDGRLVTFDCPASSIKNFGSRLRGESLEYTLEELLGK